MAEAILFWSESFDMVTHRAVALRMSDFHGSVTKAINSARALLLKMLDTKSLLAIPCDKVGDDVDNMSSGYSLWWMIEMHHGSMVQIIRNCFQ